MTSKDGAHWVVVTGAAGGIGAAVVRKLVTEGFRILAIDASISAIEDLGEAVVRTQCDVTDRIALAAAIDAIGEDQTIAGLVCCAAIFPATPALQISEALWDRVFSVNVEGVLNACQAVLPHMRRRGGGAIVLFSSMIARTGGVRAAHYAASKGAILGLARSLALDVAPVGIRVNVVSPGLTDTPQPRGNMDEAMLKKRAGMIPMGRMGQPDEMADAAVFLLSSDSSFVTGQDIRLAGGAGLF